MITLIGLQQDTTTSKDSFRESGISTQGMLLQIEKRENIHFCKKIVVYPFVQLQSMKKGLFITNDEYITVLNCVEQTGYSHI